MQNSMDQLEALVSGMKVDYEKAQLGNKAAGVRVRQGMMRIRVKAQEIRNETLAARGII